MPLLEITAVTRRHPSEELIACYLDSPVAGATLERTTVEISGWVLGKHSQPDLVEVLTDKGEVIRTIPVAVPRRDVVAVHPGAPEISGFWSLCGTLVLERQFELSIRAVLADGRRVEIGSIAGRREPPKTGFRPKLRPLVVTSQGRTGTTLLMNLLAAHPGVVTHRAYPYEVFPARYWLHLLRVLAEPADHARSSHPTTFARDYSLVGSNPFHTAPVIHDEELADLLGGAYVERLARFCQESIDDFYVTLASVQGQPGALFFAEKFQPDHVPRLAWDLYPEMKEIVLVRDFRDLICSVFAFNEKRGTLEFGRGKCESDEEYVRFVERGARRLLDAWKTRSDRAILVRYEELAAAPAATIERVLDYAGLNRAPETIERVVQAALSHPRTDHHRTTATVEESIGRWRTDLPTPLRPVVRESFDGLLEELGYEVG